MMKIRILSVLLLLTMLMSTFVACTTSGEGSQTTEAPATQPEAPTTSAPEGPDTPTYLPHSMDFVKDGIASLRVMSFNVQTDLSDPEALNRVKAVRQEILDNNPDLLGLQEDNANWIAMLNLDGYTVIGDNSLTTGTERVAIYVKDGLEILDCGWRVLNEQNAQEGNYCLTVKDVTDPQSPYYMGENELKLLGITASSSEEVFKNKYTGYLGKDGNTVSYSSGYTLLQNFRRMTWVVLNVGGQAVLYVNTHLQHRSQNSEYITESDPLYGSAIMKIRSLQRIKQFDILMDQVEEIKKTYPDAILFVTGDMNDTQIYNEEVPAKNYTYTDIFNHVQDEYGLNDSKTVSEKISTPNVEGTWNNAFRIDKYEDNYFSGKNTYGKGRLDFCFTDPKITVKDYKTGKGRAVIYVKTLSGAELKQTYYTSDHLPVIVELSYDVSGKDPEALKPVAFDTGIHGVSYNPFWYAGDPKNDANVKEYTLTTAEELLGFIYLRTLATKDAENKTVQRYSFKGVTIKLGADIVINEATVAEFQNGVERHTPWIGLNSNYLFQGTFDGQGHTVRGVHILAGEVGLRGMFGGLGDGAVIKNLVIEDAYLLTASASGKKSAGILAAKIAADATVLIENVTVKNSLIEEGTVRFQQAGGLIGIVESGASLTLKNCSFDGEIKFSKGSHVGGLIGYANHSSIKITLEGCSVTGTLNGSDYVGSLIGYVKAKEVNEINCTASATVNCTGSNKGDKYGYKNVTG